MSTPTPVKNPLTPKPKIAAAAITAGGLAVILAVLTAVTPQMLTFAHQWSALIYAGIVALGGVIAGYIKSE